MSLSVNNIINQCTEFKTLCGSPAEDLKYLPKAKEIKTIVDKAFAKYPKNKKLEAKTHEIRNIIIELHVSGAVDRAISYTKIAACAYVGYSLFGGAYKIYKTVDFFTYMATGHDISGIATRNAPDCLRFNRPQIKHPVCDLNKELPVEKVVVTILPPWAETLVEPHCHPQLPETPTVERQQKEMENSIRRQENREKANEFMNNFRSGLNKVNRPL